MTEEHPPTRWPEYDAPISPARKSMDQWFLRSVEAFVRFIGRHWLALMNLFWFAYIAIPTLAPLFMLANLPGPAQMVYGLYYGLCHQLPYRSVFIGGQKLVYTYTELWPLLDQSFAPESHRWFVGNPALGFKIALCQRDLAIYGAALLMGLVFALVRRRYRPLDWRLTILIACLLTVPMGIDGVTQLFGLRESVWQLRLLTGALFGGAWTWALYPFIEEGARQARTVQAQWEPPPDTSQETRPPDTDE